MTFVNWRGRGGEGMGENNAIRDVVVLSYRPYIAQDACGPSFPPTPSHNTACVSPHAQPLEDVVVCIVSMSYRTQSATQSTDAGYGGGGGGGDRRLLNLRDVP